MTIKNILTSVLITLPIILNGSVIVDDSIIPLIEKSEIRENLPVKKYSSNQYLEIMKALGRQNERIRIVSYNILGDDQDDFKRDKKHVWERRLPLILHLLQDMQPDILAVQELSEKQLDELYLFLSGTFDFYGEPRLKDLEINGIFYRKDRFEAYKKSVASIAENGSLNNTVTILQLRDLKTNENFAVFNTHLTFSDPDKRETEVRLIKEAMRPVANQMPIIFTGDLNTFSNRPDLDRLPFFDGDYIHRLLTKDILADARDVSLLGHVGPIASYTNAHKDAIPFLGKGTPGIFLDHIYVSEGITVLIHGIQPGTIEHKFPSDHMPVLIDCVIN